MNLYGSDLFGRPREWLSDEEEEEEEEEDASKTLPFGLIRPPPRPPRRDFTDDDEEEDEATNAAREDEASMCLLFLLLCGSLSLSLSLLSLCVFVASRSEKRYFDQEKSFRVSPPFSREFWSEKAPQKRKKK